MASQEKQQLLIQQLHEVVESLERPSVSYDERKQNVSQLKACIGSVELACQELGESQARHGGSSSVGQGRQATARIIQLEAELAERTGQLEATAAKLQTLSTLRKGDTSNEVAAMNHRVAMLTRELEERSQELEASKARCEEVQKQLWDSRQSLQVMKQSRGSENDKHRRETDKLRQELADLRGGSSHQSPQRSRSVGNVLKDPMEEESDDLLTPDYRRQVAEERREVARFRKERDDALSLVDSRTAELNRSQVNCKPPSPPPHHCCLFVPSILCPVGDIAAARQRA